ncbi:MAG: ribosome maturation factor RimP [Gammaproteobacteria bacterium]|nr:ribosome maturation factor RimP [Gammaproteobacteria bacterium]
MAQAPEGLQTIVESAATALGYELVGIEYVPQGRHTLMRVYIDSDKGIAVEDCERVSRQLSSVLDVEDPIVGEYTLEVSSPGLDRPLFKAEHYEQFSGHQVQIRLKTPLEGGRRKLKGLLLGLRDDKVVVRVDEEEFLLPLSDIDQARLVPEW